MLYRKGFIVFLRENACFRLAGLNLWYLGDGLFGQVDFDKGVVETVGGRESLLGIGLEHALQQVHGQVAGGLQLFDALEVDHTVSVQLDYVFLVLSFEQFVPSQQNEEYHPDREYVALLVVETFSVSVTQDLRGDVARSAAPFEHLVFEIEEGGESEVSDDEVRDAGGGLEEDVVRFEVSVDDLAGVHVLNGTQEVSETLPG